MSQDAINISLIHPFRRFLGCVSVTLLRFTPSLRLRPRGTREEVSVRSRRTEEPRERKAYRREPTW